MTQTPDMFAKKYNATAFDPTDPDESLAESARQAVISAYLKVIDEGRAKKGSSPMQLPYLLGGLLVGCVQVMQSSATADSQDEIDAAIRASIVQTAGWAVDTSRSMMGLDPLSDGN